MPRTIYEKPTRALLKDMLSDLDIQPGQVFTRTRVHEWFKVRYPKLTPGTLNAHLVQAATNDPSRLHHPSTNESDDLLFRVASGQYRLYEPGKDPAPIHEAVEGDVARQELLHDDEDDEVQAEGNGGTGGVGSGKFALEQDLQRYLSQNLDCVEPGLALYEEEGLSGLEYPAGNGRRIDILATDRSGALVVLELKVEKGYDRVVGQLLRYMNWVRKELAQPGQKVRGIIICRTMSEDLQLACASIPDVQLFEYHLSVTVTKVPTMELV